MQSLNPSIGLATNMHLANQSVNGASNIRGEPMGGGQHQIGMRPSSGGGALSNAGQMMMQSSNKKMNPNIQTQMRNSQNSFNVNHFAANNLSNITPSGGPTNPVPSFYHAGSPDQRD
jgi:hypothetical protein